MHQGSTLVFVAIVLGVFLTLAAFAIDGAALLAFQARLQDFADAGADAAIAVVNDLVLEKAIAREPNPPEGADPREVLTPEDREAILTDSRVEAAARDYVERNRVAFSGALDQVEVLYPVESVVCSEAARRNAIVRVNLRTPYTFLLGEVLGQTSPRTLEVSALNLLRICPTAV